MDTKALARQQDTGLAHFTPDQEALLRRTICKTAGADDFALFAQVCQRTGLDPFSRQIYLLPIGGGKLSVQVSIDGFRLIAERTNKYAGQLGPQWCGSDGEWKDVWLDEKPPAAARVAVLRQDWKEPLWGVARWRSYQRESPTWKAMPDLMIAKVAEALALRRAFPQELSGVYTVDEMAQAGTPEPEQHAIETTARELPSEPTRTEPPSDPLAGQAAKMANPQEDRQPPEDREPWTLDAVQGLIAAGMEPNPDDLTVMWRDFGASVQKVSAKAWERVPKPLPTQSPTSSLEMLDIQWSKWQAWLSEQDAKKQPVGAR